jgi:hypothetical protein
VRARPRGGEQAEADHRVAERLVTQDEGDAVAGESEPEGDPRLFPDARRPVEHRGQEEDEVGVPAVVGLGEPDEDGLVEEEQPQEAEPREHDEAAEDRRTCDDVDETGDQADERRARQIGHLDLRGRR